MSAALVAVDVEREARLRAERSSKAQFLHNKQRLESLSDKRKMNIDYLRKAHLGECFWLNTTKINKEDVSQYVATIDAAKRARQYYFFALSASKLLTELPAGAARIRAMTQLIEEWEYLFVANQAMQGVKFVMAKPSPCSFPITPPAQEGPSLHRFNNTAIVFEYLVSTSSASTSSTGSSSSSSSATSSSSSSSSPSTSSSSSFTSTPSSSTSSSSPSTSSLLLHQHQSLLLLCEHLDYVQVILFLSDALDLLYESILHAECFSNQAVFLTIAQIDAKIKHHYFAQATKELTDIAIRKLKTEGEALRDEPLGSFGLK